MTSNCSLCHFDGSFINEGVSDMINSLCRLNENADNFDLFIVGGFVEKKNYSTKLTNEIFGK